MQLTTFDKAIAAFILGLVSFVLNVLQSGHWTSNDTIALAAWIAGPGLVYFTKNKRDADPATSTPDI